jgi:hypothetical protein
MTMSAMAKPMQPLPVLSINGMRRYRSGAGFEKS